MKYRETTRTVKSKKVAQKTAKI